MNMINLLSDNEKEQLGKQKIGFRGKPKKYRYANKDEWIVLRNLLLDKSKKSNPQLNPKLTGYTPGETLKMLDNPVVKEWHREFSEYKVPEFYKIIALVPCAKTKPWYRAERGIYRSYNKIIEEVNIGVLPLTYLVTISEPLGIVPQSRWHDFPQYDNPGLFKGSAMRSGMYKKDWENSPFKNVLEMPYDDEAYKMCIDRLSDVIYSFLEKNKDKRIISFVEDFREKSTHSDMLDSAIKKGSHIYDDERFTKRKAPRDMPWNHLFKEIHRIYWDDIQRPIL
tara:strand:- start:3631 stop:4473 length:843 start_codon:yes stop_codon:yes gene_type:complete